MKSCNMIISTVSIFILAMSVTCTSASAIDKNINKDFSNDSFSIILSENYQQSQNMGAFSLAASYDKNFNIENFMIANIIDNKNNINMKSLSNDELKNYYLFNSDNESSFSWQWSDEKKCKINGYDCFKLDGNMLSDDIKYDVQLFMITTKPHIILFGCAAKNKDYFKTDEYNRMINSIYIKDPLFSNNFLMNIKNNITTLDIKDVNLISFILVVILVLIIKKILIKSNDIKTMEDIFEGDKDAQKANMSEPYYGYSQSFIDNTNSQMNSIDTFRAGHYNSHVRYDDYKNNDVLKHYK